MKEKIKVNIAGNINSKIEQIDICGTAIKVKARLSSEERIGFATEYAAHMTIIDDEAEIAYRATGENETVHYLMFKYYTNMDVSEYEDDRGAFYDMTYMYYGSIRDIIEDVWLVQEMCDEYIGMVLDVYNREHSIGHKIMKSLAGVITGDDIMKGLSESKIVNEEMIDLIRRANEPAAQDNNIMFHNFAKKPD